MTAAALAGAASPAADLLSVVNLSCEIETPGGPLRPVDNVSFTLGHGKTLGIVGESGAGKSMLARAIMGTIPGNATLTGDVVLNGQNISALPKKRTPWSSKTRISPPRFSSNATSSGVRALREWILSQLYRRRIFERLMRTMNIAMAMTIPSKTASTMLIVTERAATTATTNRSSSIKPRWRDALVRMRRTRSIDQGSTCWTAITMMAAESTTRGV